MYQFHREHYVKIRIKKQYSYIVQAKLHENVTQIMSYKLQLVSICVYLMILESFSRAPPWPNG